MLKNNKENYFKIGYCEELKIYMMHIFVSWIATYYRYYKIDEEDYNLYKNNPQSFYKKYENEIKQNNNAYTENFIGSSALRDYDGVKDFQHSYPTKNEIINPFQNYIYIEGILFARIMWEIGEFLIPPFQMKIDINENKIFPLREKCKLLYDNRGESLCYYLPFDDFKKILA